MPAKRKPPGTRVDTRPQRRQELHLVDVPQPAEFPAPPPGTLAPTKAWWEEFWKSAKGRSI